MPERNTQPEDAIFLAWTPHTWAEAVRVGTSLLGWVFRGQATPEWRLRTSLERMTDSDAVTLAMLSGREEQVIQLFQRQSDQYLIHKPAPKEYLDWLSIIQHYGGPTRLLDFTRSFYVAVFFALESAANDGTVWAINSSSLDLEYLSRSDLIPEGGHTPTLAASKRYVANHCIGRSFGPPDESPPDSDQDQEHPIADRPNVVAVEPWSLHQRMTIQQGLFLLPTVLDRSFEHNLCRGLGVPLDELPTTTPVMSADELQLRANDHTKRLALVRITIPKRLRAEALADLYRMNITAATLFPGLDGFARSLLLHPFECE